MIIWYADIYMYRRVQRMKTLVIANQKGGVGKTTLLFHLGVHLMEKGKSVLVIDLDPSANASQVFLKYDGTIDTEVTASDLFTSATLLKVAPGKGNGLYLIKADLPLLNVEKLDLAKAGNAFYANIAKLKKSAFDYLLIDTSPSLGVKLSTSLMVADFVVSPIELETFSINGIGMMLQTIDTIKTVNPKLCYLGVVPNKVRNKRQKINLDALIKGYKSLVIPCPIAIRQSFGDAMTTGKPVWKMASSAARVAGKEIRILGDYILNAMEDVGCDG